MALKCKNSTLWTLWKLGFICTNFGKNVQKSQKVDFWHKFVCLVGSWYPHPILTENSKLTILTFVHIFSNIWSKFSKIVRKSWILPFQGHIKGHIADFLGFLRIFNLFQGFQAQKTKNFAFQDHKNGVKRSYNRFLIDFARKKTKKRARRHKIWVEMDKKSTKKVI